MRVLNYFVLAVFLLCVAVQYNDPDPLRWIVIYTLAALCCFLFSIGKLPIYLAATTALAALVWALSLLPEVIGKPIAVKEVFGTIHMLSAGVEEVREIGGLLIVTTWMIVLFFKSRSFVTSAIR